LDNDFAEIRDINIRESYKPLAITGSAMVYAMILETFSIFLQAFFTKGIVTARAIFEFLL